MKNRIRERLSKYFPSCWKDDALGYLSMEFKSVYVQPTQGEVKDTDGQVKHRSDLDELLGMITVSMDFDVDSVEGEAQLQAYMEVQLVPNDTDPLMWWKQYQQELPDLSRMVRQYLTVPATSASPERFFSRVGLVQTDLCGSLLDTTMIVLTYTKHTLDHLGRDQQRGHTHTTHTHTLPTHSLTHPYIFTFLFVTHTNTLEVLLNLTHHIPGPTLPLINKLSTMLIRGLC